MTSLCMGGQALDSRYKQSMKNCSVRDSYQDKEEQKVESYSIQPPLPPAGPPEHQKPWWQELGVLNIQIFHWRDSRIPGFW